MIVTVPDIDINPYSMSLHPFPSLVLLNFYIPLHSETPELLYTISYGNSN